jgi:asparagine synthetase B (glutamine-hydrolysing)
MQPDSGTLGRSRAQQEERVHATLDESLRMQLVSDVPVGVRLSGGIDASGRFGILSRSGLRLSTSPIVLREADYSEAEHSRAIAALLRTDHHEITVSQHDAFDAIPAALRAKDQPTMDGIKTYFVSQRTRAAGVKVALSGPGGDELFAGYSSFHAVPRMPGTAGIWGVTLDLLTSSNRRPGSLVIHRRYHEQPLQLDVNLLISEFPVALADALDRVISPCCGNGPENRRGRRHG